MWFCGHKTALNVNSRVFPHFCDPLWYKHPVCNAAMKLTPSRFFSWETTPPPTSLENQVKDYTNMNRVAHVFKDESAVTGSLTRSTSHICFWGIWNILKRQTTGCCFKRGCILMSSQVCVCFLCSVVNPVYCVKRSRTPTVDASEPRCSASGSGSVNRSSSLKHTMMLKTNWRAL